MKNLLLGIFLSIILVGCTSIFDNETTSDLRVTNDVTKEVYLLAIEAELAHTIDLSPYIELSADDSRIIRPGKSYSLSEDEIQGEFEKGDELHVFIYSDPPDFERDEGNPPTEKKLFYQDQFRIYSYNELIKSNFRILISEVKTDY